jgi:hypothetical protein
MRKASPRHDTLCDVFAALDPELFKSRFMVWVDGLRDDDPDIIAIDGKTSRRSHDRRKGRNPLHFVSAWATVAKVPSAQPMECQLRGPATHRTGAAGDRGEIE